MYWCLATFISDFAGINEKLFRWKLSVAWYVDALVCVCVFFDRTYPPGPRLWLAARTHVYRALKALR